MARRAGVGVATLFRRFPTREDLITATFTDPMAEYAALIETALADPDPWHGFLRLRPRRLLHASRRPRVHRRAHPVFSGREGVRGPA
ncbi:MAG TPA: TetR/AcrR family transcriptional regulator [Propionibacteriaceae bacterium]|nr:TetR/AcrR family transcriptional regulator [Propionibacteriaceae bacterium]